MSRLLTRGNINLSNFEIGSRFGGVVVWAGLTCRVSYGQKRQT
jgi:hypothetical protein